MGSAKNRFYILNAIHSSYFIPTCKEKYLKFYTQQKIKKKIHVHINILFIQGSTIVTTTQAVQCNSHLICEQHNMH